MGLRLTIPQSAQPDSKRQVTLQKYWGHLQHELLFISWGVMDVALLTPFALSILPWARYWPPGILFLFFLLLMLLSFNLVRLMSALQLRPSSQQTILAISLILIIVFSLRALFYTPRSLLDMSWLGQFFSYINTPGNVSWWRDLILFGLIILLWVRGIQMAGRFFTIDRIGLRLRVGGLILAPFIIWLGSRALLWNPVPFILLFFLAGLTAVALTRAEEISRDETGFSASLSPRWLLFILTAGLLIVFSAGIIAIIISGESGEVVVGLINPIWSAIQITGAVAIATIGYLLQPVFYFMQWILEQFSDTFGFLGEWLFLTFVFLAKVISKLFRPDESIGDEPPSPSGDLNFVVDESQSIRFGLSLYGQIIVVLFALAIIFSVALLLRRRYRMTAVAERTTIRAQKPTSEKGAAAGLLGRLMGKLGWHDWYTAVSIRRIYKQMMQAAAQNGYPKLDSETPYEYLNTLEKAWPNNRGEIGIITEAYIKIRYGELPETDDELAQIRQAWQRLEQAYTRQSSNE